MDWSDFLKIGLFQPILLNQNVKKRRWFSNSSLPPPNAQPIDLIGDSQQEQQEKIDNYKVLGEEFIGLAVNSNLYIKFHQGRSGYKYIGINKVSQLVFLHFTFF